METKTVLCFHALNNHEPTDRLTGCILNVASLVFAYCYWQTKRNKKLQMYKLTTHHAISITFVWHCLTTKWNNKH